MPRLLRPVSLIASLMIVMLLASGCTSATMSLPNLGSPILHPSTPVIEGQIHSPGGPFLYDKEGRVVFFHGVNAVYKHPPYELFPVLGKPWNLSAADASLMARLGLNVVRLGMTWKGLEPGTAPANDPAICTPGAAQDPGQFSQSVLDAYLAKMKVSVDLLGRFHIYTLLDMHQDVYNELFDGEGAPNWAVCTSGASNADPPGRWSQNYGTAAAGAAFRHFWTNDVAGDLQGEYDRVWAAVVNYFKDDPWVLGYDPFNEPFSTSLVKSGDEKFDGQLECFYTGRAFIGAPAHGAPPISCPPGVPATGVIAAIQTADPGALVFYEPDIFSSRGSTNFVGPMPFANLVFNVHVYCGHRSGKTGNPTDIAACANQEQRSFRTRGEDRTDLGTTAQPGGPAWFLSEFGATSNPALLDHLTAEADKSLVGWTYWSWKFYADPTGSSAEGLVSSDGSLRSTAAILSRTYPQAIAGVPKSVSFDPSSGVFHLSYVPDHAVKAPTAIFVPTEVHYPNGYCAKSYGAEIISKPGNEVVLVNNYPSGHLVSVTVIPGSC